MATPAIPAPVSEALQPLSLANHDPNSDCDIIYYMSVVKDIGKEE